MPMSLFACLHAVYQRLLFSTWTVLFKLDSCNTSSFVCNSMCFSVSTKFMQICNSRIVYAIAFKATFFSTKFNQSSLLSLASPHPASKQALFQARRQRYNFGQAQRRFFYNILTILQQLPIFLFWLFFNNCVVPFRNHAALAKTWCLATKVVLPYRPPAMCRFATHVQQQSPVPELVDYSQDDVRRFCFSGHRRYLPLHIFTCAPCRNIYLQQSSLVFKRDHLSWMRKCKDSDFRNIQISCIVRKTEEPGTCIFICTSTKSHASYDRSVRKEYIYLQYNQMINAEVLKINSNFYKQNLGSISKSPD